MFLLLVRVAAEFVVEALLYQRRTGASAVEIITEGSFGLHPSVTED